MNITVLDVASNNIDPYRVDLGTAPDRGPRMLRVRGLVMMCSLLAACGPGEREGSLPDAAADAKGIAPDGQAAQCYSSGTDVEVALEAQIVQSCAIWNSLSELSGMARVSRTGNSITIDFGNGVVFTGTLTMGAVSLVYVHPHNFTDGCGWQAEETLVGQLDPATCNFALTYDYVESVVVNNGGCASPCSAQADVTLDLTPIIL